MLICVSYNICSILFFISQGVQWVKLSHEEIPSRIQAITGKRGRPRNMEKAKVKETPKVKRGRGRPPKVKMTDLLSKTDARVLKKLETQGTSWTSPFCMLVAFTRKRYSLWQWLFVSIWRKGCSLCAARKFNFCSQK